MQIILILNIKLHSKINGRKKSEFKDSNGLSSLKLNMPCSKNSLIKLNNLIC